ncbi:MAG: tail fiber protein [Acidobacteriota bacterium]|nr:tail fiber protein [Acidobacteriota bacterium]
MGTPFIGEIRMFAGNFPPKGHAFCNGQIIAIRQNTALFSLLGVTYGGDGKTTFGLPNLQGRAALSFGQGPGLQLRSMGEEGGVTSVNLIIDQMAGHNHTAGASGGNGDSPSPGGAIWSSAGVGRNPPPAYQSAANTTMSANTLGLSGGSQPHNNMQPYLAVSFIIAMEGIFPQRN